MEETIQRLESEWSSVQQESFKKPTSGTFNHWFPPRCSVMFAFFFLLLVTCTIAHFCKAPSTIYMMEQCVEIICNHQWYIYRQENYLEVCNFLLRKRHF